MSDYTCTMTPYRKQLCTAKYVDSSIMDTYEKKILKYITLGVAACSLGFIESGFVMHNNLHAATYTAIQFNTATIFSNLWK